ncbi:hypothetical protein V8E54_011024 [Elaphomyces granulatus]
MTRVAEVNLGMHPSACKATAPSSCHKATLRGGTYQYIPRGDARLPRGDARLPRGDARLPRGDARLPRGDARIPRGDARIPRGDARLPWGTKGTMHEGGTERN